MNEPTLADPTMAAALGEHRDFLLLSLADLEREHAAGDIADADYSALRHDYTARAAAVLRRLDDTRNDTSSAAGAGAVAGAEDPERTAGRRGPRPSPGRRLIVVAGVLAFAVGAGVFVARVAGERVGTAGLTGTVRSASNPTQAKIDAFLADGRAHMADDPVRALKAFEGAVGLDPTQVEAITYSGWILRLVGRSAGDPAQAKELFASARARFDRAIAIDPAYPDARAFRGILLLRDEDDPTAALADFVALNKLNAAPFIGQLVGTAEADARAAVAALPK